MNLISKIEELFNKVAWLLGAFLGKIYDKYATLGIKAFVSRCKKIICYPILKIQCLLSKIYEIKEKYFGRAEEIDLPGKESDEESDDESKPSFIAKLLRKIEPIKVKLDAYSKKTKKVIKTLTPIKTIGIIAAFILLYMKKFKAWYLALSPQVMAFSLGTMIVTATAGFSIYMSGKQIYNKENREPASIQKILPKRPVYYKGERKQLKIANIRLPIYIKSTSEMKLLTIDLTLHSSNRNIIKYLNSREHVLRDLLVTEMEPFIPTFPLEQEGKDVLKVKIKSELDQFLKKNNIEGYIKDIYIEYLMGV